MIMCHLCNFYANLIRIFLTCSHVIFLCSVFLFLHILCVCVAKKNIGFRWRRVDVQQASCEALWYNTTVDSGIVVKGLYLLTVSLPPPLLHLCLKIALDLHVRFLFGLKSWTNYALQFHRLDRELDSHWDTFLEEFASLPCYLPPMNVGAVLEL